MGQFLDSHQLNNLKDIFEKEQVRYHVLLEVPSEHLGMVGKEAHGEQMCACFIPGYIRSSSNLCTFMFLNTKNRFQFLPSEDRPPIVGLEREKAKALLFAVR